MSVYGPISENNERLWDKHESVNPKNSKMLDIAKDTVTFVGGKEQFTVNEMNYIKDALANTVSDILNKKHLTINVNIRVSKLPEKQAHKFNEYA